MNSGEAMVLVSRLARSFPGALLLSCLYQEGAIVLPMEVMLFDVDQQDRYGNEFSSLGFLEEDAERISPPAILRPPYPLGQHHGGSPAVTRPQSKKCVLILRHLCLGIIKAIYFRIGNCLDSPFLTKQVSWLPKVTRY